MEVMDNQNTDQLQIYDRHTVCHLRNYKTGGTVQTRTAKIGPARIFKCTTVVHGQPTLLTYNSLETEICRQISHIQSNIDQLQKLTRLCDLIAHLVLILCKNMRKENLTGYILEILSFFCSPLIIIIITVNSRTNFNRLVKASYLLTDTLLLQTTKRQFISDRQPLERLVKRQLTDRPMKNELDKMFKA